MQILTLILLAFGLTIDTFVVSITCGSTIKQLKINNAVKIAIFFGGFQALMPVIGWLAGISLKKYIYAYDHWIAFGLLLAVGSRMIYESIIINQDDRKIDSLSTYSLLTLSFATSIDALAVGITFAFIQVSLLYAIFIIGLITFLLSFIGVYIGNKIGHFLKINLKLPVV